MTWRTVFACVVCLAAGAPSELRAQAPDSTEASEYFAAPLASGAFALFGDLRMRAEGEDHVPGRVDRLERERATLRAGVRWTPAPLWGLELSGRASLGSDRNLEFFPNIDNEAPDSLELDRANVRFGSESHTAVRAGRLVMPLRLSEMVWDRDLRPWGIAATARWALGSLDVLRAGVAAVHRDEAELEPSLLALQLGWTWHEGAEHSVVAIASGLFFDNEDLTTASRLVRQNRVVNGRVNDMSIALLHVEGRTAWASLPLLASLDGLENMLVHDRGAVRTRLRIGSAAEHGVEAGWSYQRVEQDALPGAYGSDDWWFRSRMQGHLVWVEIAPRAWVALRAHATDEHRDDRPDHLRRLVAELTLRLADR